MNTLRTFFLLTVLTLGLVAVGGAIGGAGGALIALILAAVMNLGSYWFSDKIVLAMYRGEQVTSGPLFEVVAEICQRNQLPMRSAPASRSAAGCTRARRCQPSPPGPKPLPGVRQTPLPSSRAAQKSSDPMPRARATGGTSSQR